jgi:hypothetical protein
MPKPMKPSKIIINNEKSADKYKIDHFLNLEKYFNPKYQKEICAALKEIFEIELVLRKAINQQTQKTTPGSVKLVLENLIEALQPFVNPDLAVDNVTYDRLSCLAANMEILAKECIEENSKIKMNAGALPEHVTGFVAKLHDIYNHLGKEPSNKKIRREFIITALELTRPRLLFPDPVASAAEFDGRFMIQA